MWELPPCPRPLGTYEFPSAGVHLDLGCGERVEKRFYGVDICNPKASVWADFTKPLPFRDNSVSFIKATHICEHLSDWFAFMDECWRVLNGNGDSNRMYIAVPRPDHWHSYGDPEHVRIFHPNHFLYLTPEWHYENRVKKWTINDICWCQPEEMRVLLRPLKNTAELAARIETRDRLRKEHDNFMLFSFQET